MFQIAQQASADALGPVTPALFFCGAALVVVSAWAIVFTSSIVRMSFFLLLTLGSIAGLFFFLEAELLGAIQLIVYVGGTLILIVFGVMLTGKPPHTRTAIGRSEVVLGSLIALVLTGGLIIAWLRLTLPDAVEAANQGNPVAAVGRAMLSNYLAPFEIVGVLLLVVMVGAAHIARRKTP